MADNIVITRRDRFLSKPVSLLSQLGLKPNIISCMGVILMLLFAVFFPVHKLSAIIFLILSLSCDLFDGSLARYQNRTTNFGRLLDIICDNLNLYIFAIALIYWHYVNHALGFGLIIFSLILAAIGTAGAYMQAEKLHKNFRDMRGYWILPNVIKGIFFGLFLIGIVGGPGLAFITSITIIKIAWFVLPACAANAAPLLVRKIPIFGQSLDGRLYFRGRRLAGDHKTVRGLLAGLVAAVIVIEAQSLLFPMLKNYSVIDYSRHDLIIIGLLFGFGSLFGDFIKSIFKRQLDIPEGQSWVPFDQIDWIIGFLVFVNLYLRIGAEINLGSLILLLPLHPLFHYFGYQLGLSKDKI